MASNVHTVTVSRAELAIAEAELVKVLKSSLYPGASDESVKLVLGYCRASGLDPMQKPVHIVPMWDSKESRMRDVIMPGIGLYRTQAARSGEYAGITEPDFGPDVTENIGGVETTYPAWCRVTVKRKLPDGSVAEFTAVERWKENYAVKGGKEKSIAPNAMWLKRPYGQIAKCAQAQALRMAFPEVGSSPTADEMEGKSLDMGAAEIVENTPAASIPVGLLEAAQNAATEGRLKFGEFWKPLDASSRAALAPHLNALREACAAADAAITHEVQE